MRDVLLPAEFTFRFSAVFLLIGIVLLGVNAWVVSEGYDVPFWNWLAALAMFGIFFYWQAVPVVRVTADRVVYAVAPLRSNKVVSRDFASGFQYKERTILSDQLIIHQQTGDPIKITASQLGKDDRMKLADILDQFCSPDKPAEGKDSAGGQLGQINPQGPSPLDLT